MKLISARRLKIWHLAVVSVVALAILPIALPHKSRAQSSTTYRFIDLGTLGGTQSKALGINNCGLVVGESAPSGTTPVHPFLWRDANGNGLADAGEMKDLGTLGGPSGSATGVNSAGLVVGGSKVSTGNDHAFRWQDTNGNGIPDAGEMNDLGLLAGFTIAVAWDVNDLNQIVGQTEDDLLTVRAFTWSQGTGMQAMSTLNSIEPTIAYGINSSSHIAGYSVSNNHAFLFNGSTNTDLGTFGGSQSIAFDINNSGQAVGQAQFPGGASPPTHAFRWNGTSLQDLGVLGSGTISAAYGINTSGVMVGYSEITGNLLAPEYHAFVHDGTMRDLNGAGVVTNLPVGWVLQEARDINDAGQIVGFGKNNLGETHAFVLTPTGVTPPACPTPSPSPSPSPTPTPDVTIGVSPSPPSVTESGAANLVFTFTRTGSTANALTVNFSISGSATLGQDYTASTTGSVTIPAGSSSASVTIDPSPDQLLEGDETVVLTVTNGTGYNVGIPSAATGTITPDAPIVFTEEGNGNFAFAACSVTFVRGPFRLTNDHNFSGDHLTRVILVTSPLGMTQTDLGTGILSVRIAGYANPLPIENVGTITGVPGLNASYIVVRLPADLPNPSPGPNNLMLTVKMGSAESNATILSIIP